MTRCRIPDLCDRYRIDIGLYGPKSKRILLRSIKDRNICLHIHKNHYSVVWKKNRKGSLLNGVEEMERNFTYNKKRQTKIIQAKRFVIAFQNVKQ